MKYAQIVIGPAGSGKSTYCSAIQHHAENTHRTVKIINLDPAAEVFNYMPVADIRDLIHVDDAMEDEEMNYGPNGGLIFCMEFLMQNLSWLEEQIGDDLDDSYFIFDCPGQIELYTHLPVMKQLVDTLQLWEFKVCAIFLLDSHFMVDPASFISGTMAALSAMTSLEIPFISVLSKIDLLSRDSKRQLERFMVPDAREMSETMVHFQADSKWVQRHQRLTNCIGTILEDYSLVRYAPLNIKDEHSIETLLLMIDNTMQYGEDLDVKGAYDQPADDDAEDDGYGGESVNY